MKYQTLILFFNFSLFLFVTNSIKSQTQHAQSINAGDSGCIVKTVPPKNYPENKVKNLYLKFRLLVKHNGNDIYFTSTDDGKLIISKNDFQKYKDLDAVFSFTESIWLQFYRTPLYARSIHKLADYCGKIMVVNSRDYDSN
jgi:hypothetical protein